MPTIQTNGIPHFNIALIGDGGTGKTTYINNLKQFSLSTFYSTNNSSDHYILNVNLKFHTNHGNVKIKIHQYFSLENMNINMDAFIIMFDITKSINFNQIDQWYNTIKQMHENAPIILCGNKYDAIINNLVDVNNFVDVNNLIALNKKDMIYYHLSAKINYNVKKPFVSIFRHLIDSNVNLM